MTLAASGFAQPSPKVPRHDKPVLLFNGKDFDGFDTLLEKNGINNDPDKVFQVEKGILHISGQEFGGLVTQREYGNYYLRAEFKWGEKMYPPRLGKSRDSGIQYNITGPLKVWARMMEFQINEGGTGDIWVVNGTGMTVDGKVYQSTADPGPNQYIRIPHIGRGPLKNVAGYRDPVGDLERPHGKWNCVGAGCRSRPDLLFREWEAGEHGHRARTRHRARFSFRVRVLRSSSARCRSRP